MDINYFLFKLKTNCVKKDCDVKELKWLVC